MKHFCNCISSAFGIGSPVCGNPIPGLAGFSFGSGELSDVSRQDFSRWPAKYPDVGTGFFAGPCRDRIFRGPAKYADVATGFFAGRAGQESRQDSFRGPASRDMIFRTRWPGRCRHNSLHCIPNAFGIGNPVWGNPGPVVTGFFDQDFSRQIS